MVNTTQHSQQLLLPRFFQELSARGWPLGKNVVKQPPVELLEKLIHCAFHEDSSEDALAPLPPWLLEVFRDREQQEAHANPRKLIASYLAFSETYFDILDCMALWLDYDGCRKAGPELLFDRLATRQYELRENSFYASLSQQNFIGKLDNVLLRRSDRFNDLPLRQRLQFLGTMACENLATTSVRDAVHEQLCARYKTEAIPSAFLEYFESVQNDPFFGHVIIVNGFFSLTFSIRDYLEGLRKTTMAEKSLDNLAQGSVEQIVDHLRDSFVRGLSMHSPASHFRLEKIDLAEPMAGIALSFWQNKLREARLHQEKRQAGKREPRPACPPSQSKRAMDFHTSLVLGRIPPGSIASLELMNPGDHDKCSLRSHILGLKDEFVLLAIQAADQKHVSLAPQEAFTLRFAIETRSQGAKYYACQCAAHKVRAVAGNQCVVWAEPVSMIIPMERKHPRVAPGSLPLHQVRLRVGLRTLPDTAEQLAEKDLPDVIWPVLAGPVVLSNLSAGGACIDILDGSWRHGFQQARTAFGLMRLVLGKEPDNSQNILLGFQVRSYSQEGDFFRSGMQFIFQADQSASGKIRWRSITESGCPELSNAIFLSLLKKEPSAYSPGIPDRCR